jgi:hypothetical protein
LINIKSNKRLATLWWRYFDCETFLTLTSEVFMQRAALKTIPVPAIPTPREIALFLLAPHREPLEIIEKWDEEDNLTLIKYYSPTSD